MRQYVRCLVWGLGDEFFRHYNLLKFLEKRRDFRIEGVYSKDAYPCETMLGYKVFNNENLIPNLFDYVFIFSFTSYLDIVEDALNKGFKRETLIPYWVLDIVGFSMGRYLSLKRSNISIISNTCWGGIVYKNLGFECLSPFKNMWIEDDDYLQMLNNLKFYISKELHYIKDAYDVYQKRYYPVMALGDVKLYCNHYHNEEEAKEKWNSRVKKINWDNLFIEFAPMDSVYSGEFNKLDYAKKLLLVSDNSSVAESVYLYRVKGKPDYFPVSTNTGYGYAFDLIGTLLEGKPMAVSF